MRKISFIILFLCIAQFGGVMLADNAKADYHIIPLPQTTNMVNRASFTLNNSTKIIYPEGNPLLKRNADFLVEYIKRNTKLELTTATKGDKVNHNIILSLSKKIKGDEAYLINVNSKRVLITGRTANGVFYGIQTLRKSLPIIQKSAPIEMPAVIISDAPRFSYRGMMLDVARHFYSVDFVKEYIDLLALHNMNVFHWHLTDDQGWRIEINKYPLLTKIGSKRSSTAIGRGNQLYDGIPCGGFYTQEQAREIVRYAKERYITVIPEIDMPGHMLAALAAYPELGCTGGPYEVRRCWGISDQILCAGNENVYHFLQDILNEIMNIFPSKYIHIGGDEVPKTIWKQCPRCQAKIKALGITEEKNDNAENKLQGYFMSRIEKYLNSKGRRIIGWDEVLDGDVQQSATIMSWRGMSGGLKASKLGHDVIMTPNSYAYFDYYQTDKTWSEPLLIGGNVPLDKVYNFEPLPDSLPQEAKVHIFGVQANLWTEYIAYPSLVEYQILPRMSAISEVQWTPSSKKNFEDFKMRLKQFERIYELYGLTYRKSPM